MCPVLGIHKQHGIPALPGSHSKGEDSQQVSSQQVTRR